MDVIGQHLDRHDADWLTFLEMPTSRRGFHAWHAIFSVERGDSLCIPTGTECLVTVICVS